MKNNFIHSHYLFLVIWLILLGAAYRVPAQIINTVAGNGYSSGSGAYGDGGSATAAVLVWPNGVAFDRAGNYYISDYSGHVRKVNTSGIISTFAGTSTAGYSGDGGPATAAQLHTATDVAADTAGNIYIADYANYRVRKVNTSGVISTFAGLGSYGYTGDGGPATAAKIKGVKAITFDASGNLYLTDIGDNRIRKVTPAGIISTFAGNGSTGTTGDGGPATAAGFDGVNGIAVDAAGNVYVSEVYSSVIRKINTSGIISTIAGTAGTGGYSGDGGPATAALLSAPYGIEVDASGNIMIADLANHCVRKISSSGIMSTIAGSTSAGYTGDGGMATAATMVFPSSVALDRYENIFICDYRNCAVRRVECSVPDPGTVHGPVNVCVGSTITLTDSTTGGHWISTDTSVAVISSGGIVTGIHSGSVTIKYGVSSLCGSDTATYSISVAPASYAGTITGVDSLCVGVVTTFVSSVAGGTWVSGNPVIATINSATGVAGGVSSGVVDVYYIMSGVCGTDTASNAVVVSDIPLAGTITGADSMCAGAVTVLSTSVAGGFWTTSTGTLATVSSSGTAGATAAGTAAISYTVTNLCGSATATHFIRIDALPDAGTITGQDSVCPGATVALTATVSGGNWLSKNPAMASVSASGLATGIMPGTDTVLYIVTNPCGADTAVFVMKVRTDASCKARISTAFLQDAVAWRIIPNPNHGLFTIKLLGTDNEGSQLTIRNILGQTLKELIISAANEVTVQLDIPKGVYFVTVVKGGLPSVEKLTIE